MVVPAMTVAGALLTIARSAWALTVVSAVELLLAGLLSGVLAVTVAVLVSVVPSGVLPATVPMMVKVVLPPDARLPTVQVTVPPLAVHPLGVDRNVTPFARRSFTVPPLAVEGPLFVTTSV